jgi:hypothetical protein
MLPRQLRPPPLQPLLPMLLLLPMPTLLLMLL